MRSLISNALSSLSIWSGLYLAGAAAFVFQLTHHPSIIPLWPIAMAWAIGIGIYLIDRVKLKDGWLDPADQAAHPNQQALIEKHPRKYRATAAAFLATATLIAAFNAPENRLAFLEIIPIAAAIGVVFYAATPRKQRPRPKDIFAFKNIFTAVGISAIAITLAIGASPATQAINSPAFIFAAIALSLRATADAALSDLDDLKADAMFGTKTLPVVIGPAQTRTAALAVRMLIALSLAIIPIGPSPARLAWAATSAISTASIWASRPALLRNPIDISLGLEAAAVAIILAIL